MRQAATAHDGSHAAIKLPRKLVLACEVGRLSESFSHQKELSKIDHLHIFCTDDDNKVIRAIKGVARRVSRRGARKWALLVERIEGKDFDVRRLVRIQ